MMRHPMLQDIPFETAIEYAVDFISLIGAPALYDEKTAIVPVRDWRGPLPCDFVNMIQVRMACFQTAPCWCGIPVPQAMPTYRKSEHSFHMSKRKPHELLTGELTYKIQGMVIFTSTKDIDVEIAYRAFATDEEGYPLLPDNPSFLRGLESYIKLKWFTIKFDEGKLSLPVLQNAQQDYAWAVGDAQNEFGRLSLDDAETLSNVFKMLVPRNNAHQTAFFREGAKEIWKRH